MMMRIAWRNILRNRTRSLMSALALAAGAIAMILFGSFMLSLILGVETGAVSRDGHLTIYRVGYLDFGAGNPGTYSIDGYRALITQLEHDPMLRPLLVAVGPRVAVNGVAGNFAIDASKTFYGIGFVPSIRDRMARWDEYHIRRNGGPPAPKLRDVDVARGVTGLGLARILGFCAAAHFDGCAGAPTIAQPTIVAPTAAAGPADQFAALARQDGAAEAGTGDGIGGRLDLLAATANGAPNVVSMQIAGISRQSVREMDDAYVGMSLSLAQQLLYGRGVRKVTSIVLQLRRSEDLPQAKRYLAAILKRQREPLEFRDFAALTPMYSEVIALFGAIFGFIAIIIGCIVMFSVANSMTMSVVERTAEIGTLRSMGVQRETVRRQFLTEGLMLGLVGASVGVVFAMLIATIVNAFKLTWIPPGETYPVPLHLTIWVYPALILLSWIGLIAAAGLAAWIPANRAARLTVVDAMRH